MWFQIRLVPQTSADGVGEMKEAEHVWTGWQSCLDNRGRWDAGCRPCHAQEAMTSLSWVCGSAPPDTFRAICPRATSSMSAPGPRW